jgi:hypothetical protein
MYLQCNNNHNNNKTSVQEKKEMMDNMISEKKDIFLKLKKISVSFSFFLIQGPSLISTASNFIYESNFEKLH